MSILKRVAHTTLLPKLLWAALLWVGVSDRNTALIMTVIISAYCIRIYRKGVREQYWAPMELIAQRHWEDLVWDHSVWVNPDETPEQAIERLAGPWKRKLECRPSSMTSKRSTSLRKMAARSIRSVRSALASTHAGQSGSLTQQSGPHFLPVSGRSRSASI